MSEKQANKAAKKANGGKKKIGLFLLIGMIMGTVLAAPTLVVLGVGMIPTLVAWMWDRDPNKYAPLTVGGLNFCGTLLFMFDLWQGDNSFDQAIAIVSNPMSWMVMYGTACAGWAIYFVIPVGIASMVTYKAQFDIEAIEKERANLLEEFGEDLVKVD